MIQTTKSIDERLNETLKKKDEDVTSAEENLQTAEKRRTLFQEMVGEFHQVTNVSDDYLRLECMEESQGQQAAHLIDPAYRYLTELIKSYEKRIRNGETSNHYINPYAPDLYASIRALENYKSAIKNRTILEKDYKAYARLAERELNEKGHLDFQ